MSDNPAWMSKGPADVASVLTNIQRREGTGCTGVAHLIDSDGKPLCSRPLFVFRCTWVALRPFDKKCGLCRRIHDGLEPPVRAGGHPVIGAAPPSDCDVELFEDDEHGGPIRWYRQHDFSGYVCPRALCDHHADAQLEMGVDLRAG